jgi:hypothetical protein
MRMILYDSVPMEASLSIGSSPGVVDAPLSMSPPDASLARELRCLDARKCGSEMEDFRRNLQGGWILFG